MSLPIAAGGPLKVLMKPILTVFSWAVAGPAASASMAAAASVILVIVSFPLLAARPGAEALGAGRSRGYLPRGGYERARARRSSRTCGLVNRAGGRDKPVA